MKLETHHAPPRPATRKEWSWSYSKLKNFIVCPKRMYNVDIAKTYADSGGEALDWGNAVHEALKVALKNSTALPPSMTAYQYWVDRVRAGRGELLVEQKYGITRDFQKTAYFADNVWYRGIGDVVRIDTPFIDKFGTPRRVALVLDWKTGKVLDDPVQLMLMAQCLFSHYPDLTDVRSSYVWLKDDSETPEHFTREEVAEKWRDLLPKVLLMEQAAKDNNYPPLPGKLCRSYCPVTSCPFHGKGVSGR